MSETTLAIDPTIIAEELLSMTGRQSLDKQFPDREDKESRLRLVEEACVDLFEALDAYWGIADPDEDDREEIDSVVKGAINRCLLALDMDTISREFVRTVLRPEVFRDEEVLRTTVGRFRKLSMYFFGSFEHGYNVFRIDDDSDRPLAECWTRLFGPEKGPEEFSSRPSLGIHPVEGHNLWTLGYVAKKHRPEVNEARETLKPVLQQALKDDVSDWEELREMTEEEFGYAVGEQKGTLSALLRRANLRTNLQRLVDVPPYEERLGRAIEECETVSEKAIDRLREQGKNNTNVYITTEELDVYVATSMRKPSDFTTQAALVHNIFEKGVLNELNVRYFDPTQAFTHDRVDKGLMECLMIMRSKVVLYNAQERDTFGKDSEIAYGLSLGKPAVVYVGRLFEDKPAFDDVYEFIDNNVGRPKDDLIQNAVSGEPPLFWDRDREDELWEQATARDVIEHIVKEELEGELKDITIPELRSELQELGYEFFPPQEAFEGDYTEADYKEDLVEFALKRIKALEGRAYVFSELHPLSLQTSPFDGVARGVMVCRTPKRVRKLIKALLLQDMEYAIDETDRVFLLREQITNSPVRVVTKDAMLTKGFWNTFERLSDGSPPPSPP